jgi:queuosine precursor transporter
MSGPKFIPLLTALNATFLLVSDFTGARIISLHGVGVSVTVLYFPMTYLLGDVLTEVYGYAQSRRVIWISMFCSIAGSVIGGGQLAVPAAGFFAADAAYQTVFSPSLTVSARAHRFTALRRETGRGLRAYGWSRRRSAFASRRRG